MLLSRPGTVCLLSLLLAASASADVADLPYLIPGRWFEPFLPEALPPQTFPEYFTDLDKARLQIRTGRYKQALYTVYHLPASDDKAKLQTEALLQLGRADQAANAIAKSQLPGTPQGELLLARIDLAKWQRAAAVTRLQAVLKDHPTAVQARAMLGRLLEDQGDPAAALEVYAWAADPKQGYLASWLGHNEDALGTPDDILAIATCLNRHAYLTSRFAADRSLHDTILSMFVRVYDVIDRGNPEAHVLAARFFLAHDDPEQAMGELDAALKINPRHLDAWYLTGSISAEYFDFDRAEQAIGQIRRVLPDSRQADVLEARSLLAQRQPQPAMEPIQRLLASSPDDVESLSLLASAQALLWQTAASNQTLAKIQRLSPNPAGAYFEVGDQLSGMRQYKASETMLQRAVELAPWMSEARNALGLLYTQSGDEAAARTTLEAAYQLDPFNLRATNYLRLLDELDKFARKESAHFIVLHDAKTEGFLADEVSAYMETQYPRICKLFDHEPTQKTMIEIFPSHDRFSVRTTGSPWIGTIGASTGRVIALVAPRTGPDTMGQFDWAEVLRHEFTHTVTLSATSNRIPHWLTEGFAVSEEAVPIKWEWVPMLSEAVQKNKLFTLDNITWGFVRPRRPVDRPLAYAQSYLMCRYIRQRYGDAALPKMLKALNEGTPEQPAMRLATGVDPKQFEAEFGQWMRELVATWGHDPVATQKYDELTKRGEQLIADKRLADAVPVWEDAAKIRPMDVLPHQRLAGLYLSRALNKPLLAADHLALLDKAEIKNNRYSLRLAKLYQQQNELPKAVDFAEHATRVNPWDPDARELLAKLLTATGDSAGAQRETEIAAQIRSASARPADGDQPPATQD